MALDDLDIPIMEEVVCDNPGPANATTQTDNEGPRVLCDIDTQTSRQLPLMDISEFQHDAPGLKYYTGLGDYNMFICVLASLGPGAYKLQYWNNINPSISGQYPC